DPLDLQALLIARRHPLDHVRDQRAGEAVQRAMLAAIGRPGDEQLLAVLLDLYVLVDALGQFALWSVHAHRVGLDRNGHAGRNWDGLSADSGHLLTRPAPGPRRRRRP